MRPSDLRIVAFDLDDTLAPSKSALPGAMSRALADLIDVVDVCIISGGHLPQFQQQVLTRLPKRTQFGRLHLMPTCGTRYLRFQDGTWIEQYAYLIDDDVRQSAIALIEARARELGLWEEHPWGDIIEDRGSQITFSALGQEAPVEAKKAWDPDARKRTLLCEALNGHLPGLHVHVGGSTSVDITLEGVDKAFGISKLMEYTGASAHEILFVGDRLEEGGNDYPVTALGVHTHPVRCWQDTLSLVSDLLDS